MIFSSSVRFTPPPPGLPALSPLPIPRGRAVLTLPEVVRATVEVARVERTSDMVLEVVWRKGGVFEEKDKGKEV